MLDDIRKHNPLPCFMLSPLEYFLRSLSNDRQNVLPGVMQPAYLLYDFDAPDDGLKFGILIALLPGGKVPSKSEGLFRLKAYNITCFLNMQDL